MADTYNNLYLDARRALKAAGAGQPQLEAGELLGLAAGKSREQLLRDLALYAPDGVETRFRALLDRRLAGEPLAYILGEWDFYALTLEIGPDVLIPRSDTETLAERGILAARAAPGQARVLDLCAGSGCVGLAVADNCPQASVVLGEWSEPALRVCRRNIVRCGLSMRVSAARVDALESAPPLLRDFAVLVCNPPYIPTGEWERLDRCVRDYEPRVALDGGEDGLKFYRAVARGWERALVSGGKLIFEVGWDQAPDVERILSEQGYEEIRTFQDAGGHWRVVEGTKKKDEDDDNGREEETHRDGGPQLG